MGKKKKNKSKPQGNPSTEHYLADVCARVVSGTMGLVAFALTAFIGLWAGNPAIVTLTRALVACAICALIGRVLGSIGEMCVREFVKDYKLQNPKPGLPPELVQLEQTRLAHEQIVDEMRNKAA